MVSRLYLESLAAEVQKEFDAETLRQYLSILAEAPDELFADVSREQQAQRAVLLLRGYQGSRTVPHGDVGLEIVNVTTESVLLSVVDLRDGAVVIAPLPLHTARQFALQLLMRIHQASDIPEEEEQVGQVPESVN